MKRGEVWTVSGGADYAGKPRPAVIVQANHYPAIDSVTLCALTSEISESPLTRPVIEPSPASGLANESRVMIDKISTVYRQRMGRHIGHLSQTEMETIDKALLIFLGLAE